VVVPAISILTVIGIIPFASSVARQIWVRKEGRERRVRGRKCLRAWGPGRHREPSLHSSSLPTLIAFLLFSIIHGYKVKYKITSRRISVTSGVGGKDLTEVRKGREGGM
jgi:hypothetical protein